MQFTIVSEQGQGLGLASHLSSEGHSVAFKCSLNNTIGKGVTNCLHNGNADITLFDYDKAGLLADELRSDGKRVLGASHWSDMIEKNSEYQKKLIEAIGFSKTALNRGINIYVTCWFNGANFISSYVSIVYRRFMSGGRGADLGCTGFISSFEGQPSSKITERILEPLKPILRKVNHRGCFHTHLLVHEDAFDVKEISASMNHPLCLSLYENSKDSTTNILLALLNESSQPFQTLEKWTCGILTTLPPYPYNQEERELTLSGLNEKALKHFWICDAFKEGNAWKTTGQTGNLGYITARGRSITPDRDPITKRRYQQSETLRRAFRTLNNIQLRDLQYRNDIGRGVNWMLKGLRQYKWIK